MAASFSVLADEEALEILGQLQEQFGRADERIYFLTRVDFAGIGLSSATGPADIEFIIARRRKDGRFDPAGKRSDSSARFVRDDQNAVWLAHSGRIHHKKGRIPKGDVSIVVNGRPRQMHLVHRVGDSDLVGDLQKFAAMRIPPIADKMSIVDERAISLAIDPGATVEFSRMASDCSPRHSPIVKALCSAIEAIGGYPSPTDDHNGVRFDLCADL